MERGMRFTRMATRQSIFIPETTARGCAIHGTLLCLRPVPMQLVHHNKMRLCGEAHARSTRTHGTHRHTHRCTHRRMRGAARHNTARDSMTPRDTAHHSMAQHSTAGCSTAGTHEHIHDTACCGAERSGVVGHNGDAHRCSAAWCWVSNAITI